LAAGLLVSVATNVLLAHRLRSLMSERSSRLAERVLKIGAFVPPISAKRLDGGMEVISYGGTNRPTVLYIFTPTCPWCARNVDSFKELVAKKSAEYRFIGLSLSPEGLPEYVATRGLTIPVYGGMSIDTLNTYKLGSTPQTIVVSPEGRVLEDWVGAYMGSQESKVEAFFHVTLPDVQAGPVTGIVH